MTQRVFLALQQGVRECGGQIVGMLWGTKNETALRLRGRIESILWSLRFGGRVLGDAPGAVIELTSRAATPQYRRTTAQSVRVGDGARGLYVNGAAAITAAQVPAAVLLWQRPRPIHADQRRSGPPAPRG